MIDAEIQDKLEHADAAVSNAMPMRYSSYAGVGEIRELCVAVGYLHDAIRLLAEQQQKTTRD
jgi:hypothetical protein